MKYEYLYYLDDKAHWLNDRYLLPEFITSYICDAWEYKVTGGESGKKHWPFNRK